MNQYVLIYKHFKQYKINKETGMNYFSIERNGECWSPVILADKNGEFIAKVREFLEMNYDEMKSSDLLNDFVAAVMEAADGMGNVEEEQTIVTLIGGDNIFIWSIIMGSDGDDIRYVLVDWKKDGYSYRYEP